MRCDSQDAFEIELYQLKSADTHLSDHFTPSLQSLRSAHEIIRRYNKKRRGLQRRRTVTASTPGLGVSIAVGENIIPLRSLGWPRPSSRLSRSRHYAPPYTQSPASRPRRASSQREAWRASRYVTTSGPSPIGSKDAVIVDGVHGDLLERLGVMAIQGLAVSFGLSGFLVVLSKLV